MLDRIGMVAYRLQLPEGSRLYNVFHVGLLKKFYSTPPTAIPVLPPIDNGRPIPVPAKILKASLRRDVWHVLVQWVGLPPADASWESVEDFKRDYPSFQLENELFAEAGRDVMWGIPYQRRKARRTAQTPAAENGIS